MTSTSRKSRAYQLSAEYRQFIGDITAITKAKSWMPGTHVCQAFLFTVSEKK